MKVFWEKRGSFRFGLVWCYPDMVKEEIYAYRIFSVVVFGFFKLQQQIEKPKNHNREVLIINALGFINMRKLGCYLQAYWRQYSHWVDIAGDPNKQ